MVLAILTGLTTMFLTGDQRANVRLILIRHVKGEMILNKIPTAEWVTTIMKIRIRGAEEDNTPILMKARSKETPGDMSTGPEVMDTVRKTSGETTSNAEGITTGKKRTLI